MGVYVILTLLISYCLYRLFRKKRVKLRTLTLQEFNRQNKLRIKGCCEVLESFKTDCRYLLNQCFTIDELRLLINQGIQPGDLRQEIIARIKELKGLPLGFIWHDKQKYEVRLTDYYRDMHIWIVGRTRKGKTTLINNMIKHDIQNGHGVGVICYEYDQFLDILSMIPPHRFDDLIIDPPFNPLYLDDNEDINLKIDETLTLFKRIIENTSSQMDEILRHTLYALIKTPNTTLLDIEKLLDRKNNSFRFRLMNKLHIEEQQFWKNTFPQYPKNVHLPLVHRIGSLVGLPESPCRKILCNPDQSLNFARAMQEGRIMLFNLNDGILGAENANLLGRLIIAKFQTSLMTRATSNDRRPFYFYLDEFQQMMEPESLSKLLARGLKYKLSVVIANQETHQIPSDVLHATLGNVGAIVTFALSYDDSCKLSRELKKEVEPEQIQDLGVGETFCKIDKFCFGMQTYAFKREGKHIEFLIERARENYGVKSEEQLTNIEMICLNENEDIFKKLRPEKVFDDRAN
jgi:hypothetical protein